MLSLVFSMLLATVLAVAVVAAVAVQARHDGRGLLTARGERVVDSARARAVAVSQRTADTH